MQLSRLGARVALAATSLVAATALVSGAGTSIATASSAATSAATVEKQASSLPQPTNDTQLRAEVQKLVPGVKAAIAASPSNATALQQSGNKLIAGALLVATPLSGSGAAGTSAQTPFAFQPDSTTCWGNVYGQDGSMTVVGVQASIDGWCGNGVSVTSHGPVSFRVVANGPYCDKNVSENQGYAPGPEGPHVYYDASVSSDMGISYVFGCGGLVTYNAYIHVKGNGYSDGGGSD